MSLMINKRVLLVGSLFAAVLTGGFSAYRFIWPAEKSAATAALDHAAADYTCSMHPDVHATTPGNCPICGMKLTKKAPAAQLQQTASTTSAHAATLPGRMDASSLPPGLQEVTLSPEQQVLANVATERIAPRRLESQITAAGQIAYDETRLSQVAARVDGRIERLYVNSTGARIHKGQAMGTIYSPDVVSTMQEYLTALASYREMKNSPYPEIADGARSLLEASRQRLKLWDISPSQIAQLERTKSPAFSLALMAPNSGVVIKKQVQPGQYVKTGDVLYEIADLSRVWVEANLFEAQLRDVKVGQRVEVTSPAYPGVTFVGRVAFIYPFLNPETRTVKVRAELSNSDGRLKPEMFVTASIASSVGKASQLAVPSSAVLDAGRRKLVYVEVSSGVFRPREVSLGQKAGKYYPVLAGLRAGERVATSGGFLLDASSQLQAGGSDQMEGMAMPEKGATR